MVRTRLPLALAIAALASACVKGPDYRPADAATLGVPESYSVATDTAPQEDLTHWWDKFDDPELASLVERGRAANLDIAQAVSRLRQAREALVQTRSQLVPTVGASGGYSRNQQIAGTSFGADDSFSIGGDASYQVDLFGGVARSVEAARAQYQGAGYSLATVQISVQAEIARNYILARAAQAQLANARQSLGIQDDNLQISQWRVQAGLVSSLDVEQARASRAQTAASIPSIEANYNAAVSRIGVLLGQAPGALKAELEAPAPIPVGPASVAVGIPADTLRQRPDVRAAERDLAAATAQIGVARADLFPALSVGGSISAGAAAIDGIFDAISGRLFANIAQTLFDGGRRASQLRASQAAAEGAFAAYRQTVLTALEDVENAVVALDSAQRREAEFRIALEAANNSALLSRNLYQSGLTDFTTLNNAEASLISARNGVTQAQADQASALVQLYLALGGGWDASAVPTAPAAPPAPLPTSQERDR